MSTGHANSIERNAEAAGSYVFAKGSFSDRSYKGADCPGNRYNRTPWRIAQKGRKVLEIAEIQGLNNNKFIINSIFNYKFDQGLIATGNKIVNTDKLKFAGIEI